jgi:predicted dehydrogenase
MLTAAIVGCGKIADDHAQSILRIPGARLAGFYDAEPLMARQMEDRFGGRAFPDLESLLSSSPDVVHITTPPQSHYALAMRCLAASCHVFVEKPFTMTAEETVAILTEATRRDRKVSVDHNLQFSDPALRLRALIRDGFLGGAPIHSESYYCYDLSDPGYARAFLSDTGHWLRSLPGGLLQNVISHGIARIAEHLPSEAPEVTAIGFTSDTLRSVGERELLDELRVLIRDGSATAYFTFSSQMRPSVSQFRVFGRCNGAMIDDSQQTVVRLEGRRQKSYLEMVVPPARLSRQYLANSVLNVRRFLGRRLHMNDGMRVLIARFYESIADDAPLPIPYAEILRTARIMDAIFAQVAARECVSA